LRPKPALCVGHHPLDCGKRPIPVFEDVESANPKHPHSLQLGVAVLRPVMQKPFWPVPPLAVDLKPDTLVNDDVDVSGPRHITLCSNREARPKKLQPRECLVAGLSAAVDPGQHWMKPRRRVKKHQIELVVTEESCVQRRLDAGECIIGAEAMNGLQDGVDRRDFEQVCAANSATPMNASAGDRFACMLVWFHPKVQAGSLQARPHVMPREAAHAVEASACLGREYKWGVDVRACVDPSNETPDQSGFAGLPELTDREIALQLGGRCHVTSITQQGDDVSTHPRSVGDFTPGFADPGSSVESCPPVCRGEGTAQAALPRTPEVEAV
jgi:hypothetical protein